MLGTNKHNGVSVAFVGGFFTKEDEASILNNTNGRVQYAANNYQFALIDGLSLTSHNKIFLISELFIGNYPKRYKKLIVKKKRIRYNNEDGIQVGFLNLAIVLDIMKAHGGYQELSKWLSNGDDCHKVVIGYSFAPSILMTLAKIKKRYPETLTCMVVPDLLEFLGLDEKKHLSGRIFTSFQKHVAKKCLNRIDCFVPLTEEMMERIPNSEGKPYCVVEGVFRSETFLEEKVSSTEPAKKTILYTGGISGKYGVVKLIDAFRTIVDANYELILCGGINENEKELINEKIKSDKRIRYLGQVSHDEIIGLQRKATVLVNPREADEFTKYSFPSKTLEYLGSGTPVVGYKLPGIPDEYDDHIFYVCDNTASSLAKLIVDVCEKTREERTLIGERNKRFVVSQKSSQMQAGKIFKMFYEIISKERQ